MRRVVADAFDRAAAAQRAWAATPLAERVRTVQRFGQARPSCACVCAFVEERESLT